MFVKQFRYFSDNLGYLVYSKTQGVIIDAGGIDAMLKFAKDSGITIKAVTNTHMHHDHTSGNKDLLKATGAEFIDPRKITGDQIIEIDQEVLEVFPTPGHTDHCVTFKADDFIITGDALFNGTVGNCFSGDMLAFFNSLKRIISLPPETKVYGGHDYVLESMKMAKIIEGENPHIAKYTQKYDSALIVSTIQDELDANPYVRFNAEGMISRLKEKKLPLETEFDRFKSIMEIY